MFYAGNEERRDSRPITPMSSINTLSPTPMSPRADEEDDDDLMLPGSLNDNVLNQKFKRLQEAAQKSRPPTRGGMGIVQSSRPMSARGARPTSSNPNIGSGFSTNNMNGGSSTNSRPFLSNPPLAQNPLNYSATSPVTTPRLSSHAGHDIELLEELENIRNSRQQAALDLETKLKERGIVASFDPTIHNDPVLAAQLPPPTFRQHGRPKLDLSDRRRFISTPPPVEYGFVRCYITRDKDKFNKLFPRYFLWHEDTKTFLLSGKKRKKNKSSNYSISLDDKDMSRNSGSFFGKLRSNFLGTEFTMYDKGDNAKQGEVVSNVRKQIGVIAYETNILGTKGPRKLTVITPDVGSDGKHYDFPELPQRPSIIEKYKAGQTEKLRVFKNKSPVWNEKLKAYVLNFNGRVTKASVKNFQLCDVNDQGKTYLQFGKVDDDKFTLDFKHPFSGVQAFCVALSAFDTKLACE